MMKTKWTRIFAGLILANFLCLGIGVLSAGPVEDCEKSAEDAKKTAKKQCKALEKDKRKPCFQAAKDNYTKAKAACKK